MNQHNNNYNNFQVKRLRDQKDIRKSIYGVTSNSDFIRSA